MSCIQCPLEHPWLAVWALTLPMLAGTPQAGAGSGDPWMTCQDRVIAGLEVLGMSKYGSISAYTGATGVGAQDAVIERCGYHPEPVGHTLCDDIYRQVYPACREDGFEEMPTAAASWVLIFDPAGALVGRLRQVCAQAAPVSRAAFGRLVCRD